jgi:hypothetical protein
MIIRWNSKIEWCMLFIGCLFYTLHLIVPHHHDFRLHSSDLKNSPFTLIDCVSDSGFNHYAQVPEEDIYSQEQYNCPSIDPKWLQTKYVGYSQYQQYFIDQATIAQFLAQFRSWLMAKCQAVSNKKSTLSPKIPDP